MNILVITPINPVQIVELGNKFEKLASRVNSIVSPQVMALLAESIDEKDNYLKANFRFAQALAKNPALMLKNQEVNLVVWGNIPKVGGPWRWDHIVYLATPPFTEDETDPYIEKVVEVYKSTKLPSYDWYTRADTEYTFPTFHHLEVFLKTRGVIPATPGGLDEL